MYDIDSNIIERNMFYKNELILKYKIEYPKIISKSCMGNKFNEFNLKKALYLQNYAENNLFEEAVKQYEYNVKNGYPIMVYELYYTYNITYNKSNIVSLTTDNYIFSGGAHGLTKREGQTWNISCQRLMNLKEFYKCDSNYIVEILKQIISQIEIQMEKGENNYFDNYCSLVLNTFNENQFYIISDKELAIFFNQYDIAPYSSGIPVFIVKRCN